MKMKHTNTPRTYYIAFYCIEDDKLFAAYGDKEYYTPAFPVVNRLNGMYNFIGRVETQEFVDEMLNRMWVHYADPDKKISVEIRDKESLVSSNDKIIFAAGSSMEALHFATKQIYENLDQFKGHHFAGYSEELKLGPQAITKKRNR